MKRNDIFVLAAGLLVGAGLAVFIYYGLDYGSSDKTPSEEVPGVNLPESASVGTIAPNFELLNLEGKSVRLSELQGKIVILNFWATWCEPCKLEMPFFEKLHQTGEYNLEILGINFDEPPPQVEQFVDEFNLHFPILLDPGGEVQKLYRVRGYPTTLIVDEAAIIQYHHIGIITEDQLNHYLAEMGVDE